jgi:hypothetical protein
MEILMEPEHFIVPSTKTKLAENLKAPEDLIVIEDRMYGCGGVIWDAAILMSSFVSSKLNLSGKSVLELGAGSLLD